MIISCGTKSQYVILLADGSHRCTCNMLVTHGYPCRHFYKILRCSTQAKWHIGLITSRWYKDDIIEKNNDIWLQDSVILCVNPDEYQMSDTNTMHNFDYIKQVRGSEVYNSALREINNT